MSTSITADNIPLEVIQTILLETDYATVLRFSQTSKKWRDIILSDNTFWKSIYQRRHRIIGNEKAWIKTCIDRLTTFQHDTSTDHINEDNLMEMKWHHIDWKLALEYRIRTENHWRLDRPQRVIHTERLSDIMDKIGSVYQHSTHAGSWQVWMNYVSNAPQDQTGILHIQHIHRKLHHLHHFDIDSNWIIQSQSKNSITLLFLKGNDTQDTFIQWQLYHIHSSETSLTERLCAEGTLTEIDIECEVFTRLDERYMLFRSGVCMDEETNDHLFYKIYIVKYNIPVNHYLTNSSQKSLSLQVVWHCKVIKYKTFPELGYICCNTSDINWHLFNMTTGECIRSFELDLGTSITHILGPLCVGKKDNTSYLIDFVEGKIIRTFPEGYVGLRKTTNGTFFIEATYEPQVKFLILDYNHLDDRSNDQSL
jgi:hypothetical protein